jgi:hypothetical protein
MRPKSPQDLKSPRSLKLSRCPKKSIGSIRVKNSIRSERLKKSIRSNRFNPKRCGLLGGVLFGEMKFVLSNFLSNEDLSISYES